MTEQEKFEAWFSQHGYDEQHRAMFTIVWQAATASRSDCEEDNQLLRAQNDMLDKRLAEIEQGLSPSRQERRPAVARPTRRGHGPAVKPRLTYTPTMRWCCAASPSTFLASRAAYGPSPMEAYVVWFDLNFPMSSTRPRTTAQFRVYYGLTAR